MTEQPDRRELRDYVMKHYKKDRVIEPANQKKGFLLMVSLFLGNNRVLLNFEISKNHYDQVSI